MLGKVHNWIIILGLFLSGPNFVMPAHSYSPGQANITEQIIQQREELPAAPYFTSFRKSTPDAFSWFRTYHFPSLLELHINKVHLQRKTQSLVVLKQDDHFSQLNFSSLLSRINPPAH